MKDKDKSINYLFFIFYFLCISCLHLLHVFLIEPLPSPSTHIFSIYALAQCFLETWGLIIIGSLISRYFSKYLSLYVFLVLCLLLIHFIDFPLVRLMDMSFWFAFSFIIQESYANFIEFLLASNISLWIWLLITLTVIASLLIGVFCFHLTHRLTRKKTWKPSFSYLNTVLSIGILFLFGWNYGVLPITKQTLKERFEKTLPWKHAFSQKNFELISLKTHLKELPHQEEFIHKLDSRSFSLVHKPDIYLFVIESLREDYICEEVTPNLAQFREQSISFPMALSNANATHLSWFSIFCSQYPLYWKGINAEETQKGSIPLILLKKMGYKIHLFSSARLSYCQMDRMIFGEGGYLVDSSLTPNDIEIYDPYERDIQTMNGVLQEMRKEGSGRMFIIFLDGTHLGYSWPKEMSRFFPFDEKINYLKAAFIKENLEGIKNRYKNALYFADSLFGKFFQTLQQSPEGKESVVIVTGDHGEEFYEDGRLFHASHLSHPQIHVPLYYRLGKNFHLKEQNNCKMTCHMDIFPTLFHYLCGEDLVGEILQGESIFKSNRWPYTVITRFNASRNPSQFCIHNGSCKLFMEFDQPGGIFHSNVLKVLQAKNSLDEELDEDVQEEFRAALEKLFPK